MIGTSTFRFRELGQRTLAPASWLVERMRLSAKMVLIGALFLAPALWLAFAHFQTMNAQVAFSARELRGVPMVVAASRVMQPMQRCRGLVQQRLRRLDVPQTAIQACRVATDAALLDLLKVQAANEDLLPGGLAALRSIQTRWQGLRSVSTAVRPDQNFADYSALVRELISYIRGAADHSNLTLDIEVDSFYLMDSVTVHLPEQIEAAAALRGSAAARVGTGPLTVSELTRLTVLMHDLDLSAERVHQDIARLADVIPGTAATLNALDAAKAAMYASLQQQLLNAVPAPASPMALFDRGSLLVDAGYAALDQFSGLLA